MESEIVPHNQNVVVLETGEEFEIPSGCYVRLERFSILEDYPDLEGQRVSVLMHVDAPTSDGRTATMNAAINSFIIGKDFEQVSDLIIAPSDEATMKVVGAPVKVQVLFTKFPE